ncbi:hypothetical protein KSP39_PZI001329 [Platanthera zijinensis]|uniref:Uncharacterized protein n=1 Tax=Platanthera zijinensis TaxID=2320716 RepID=A0AAP0C559_9ASPA
MQALEDIPSNGQRFKRILRQSWASNLELYPLLDENLEQWPHLNELVQCCKVDWIKDESKYGRYGGETSFSFQNQIYEGFDTDIETEMRLACARDSKVDDANDDDDAPSTSGRPISESASHSSWLKDFQHFGDSPLPAYEPTFDWENERLLIFGQRIPEPLPTQCDSGLKISVKVLSLSLEAGLAEPFYGTICLYNRERREKLSEEFYFDVIPTEMQQASISTERVVFFSLDSPSTSVCLLIQLEKTATEEGGITSSVYSRKEPVNLNEKEKQKLQIWSRLMPYREPFCWAIVPLFENHNTSGGDAASPTSHLTPSMSGSISQDGIIEPAAKIPYDGKLPSCSIRNSVIVEVSNLNKVKENYIEDSLQGALRLEVDKFLANHAGSDNFSETGSATNDLNDIVGSGGPADGSDVHRNGSLKLNSFDRKKQRKSFLQMNAGIGPHYSNDEVVSVGLQMDLSLPVMKELAPHYLQDNVKERLDYLEDGKAVFRLRLRICSTLFPLNERIRDFFLEYDRHVLRTSPPWGSELLEAINSLKNVESSALLQFLQPILNMLLNLIGDGGETLQVAAFRAMVNILTR